MTALRRVNGALRGYLPWLVMAAAGAYFGSEFLSSPGGAVGERLRAYRERVSGQPMADTPATRALGYAGAVRTYGLEVSSLDSLLERETIQLGAGGTPRYVHSALPEYLRAPQSYHIPITLQDFRAIAALPAPVIPPAGGDAAITAADVLSAARSSR